MIRSTTITLNIDVDADATPEELRLIKEFTEIETELVENDFAEVFDITVDQTTAKSWITPGKGRKSRYRKAVKRIKKAYGL